MKVKNESNKKDETKKIKTMSRKIPECFLLVLFHMNLFSFFCSSFTHFCLLCYPSFTRFLFFFFTSGFLAHIFHLQHIAKKSSYTVFHSFDLPFPI